MSIELKTKKDLLAVLSDSLLQGFDPEGKMIAFTPFEGVDYNWADKLHQDINENLREWLNEHSEYNGIETTISFDLNPQDFTRAALRNIELDGEVQILHATFWIGYQYHRTYTILEGFKSQQQNDDRDNYGGTDQY